MPIFELDEGRARLVQPMQPLPGSFANDCAALLTHHLAAIAGEPLFPVRRRSGAPDHADLPELLALDSTGRTVVVEVVQVLDDDAVVAALRHAGAAARMTATDLARSYHADPDRFAVDFAAFREQVAYGMTTSRREGVRLVVLCSEVAAEAGDTLGYLRGPGRHVDVLQLGVVRGADDRRLLEVAPLARHENVRRPVEPTALRLVRSSEASFATAMAYEGDRRRPPSPVGHATATFGAPNTSTGAPAAPGLPPASAFPSAPPVTAATPAGVPHRAARSSDDTTVVPPVPADPGPAGARTPVRQSVLPATPAGPGQDARPASSYAGDLPAGTLPAGTHPAAPYAAPRQSGAATALPGATPMSSALVTDLLGSNPSTRSMPSAPAPQQPWSAQPSTPYTPGGLRPAGGEQAATPVRGVPRTAASSSGTPARAVSTEPTPAVPTESEPAPVEPGRSEPDAPASAVEPRTTPYPELGILAKQRRALATLVWLRERRNQRIVALLRHDGLIELPDGRTYIEPGDAAAAAAGSLTEIDGWRAWRLGDGGPTLAEATGRGHL